MERLAVERWHKTGRGAIRVAFIAEGLGERDKAFEGLDRTGNDRLMSAAVMYPLFDDPHSDPRFESFRQRIGATTRR